MNFCSKSDVHCPGHALLGKLEIVISFYRTGEAFHLSASLSEEQHLLPGTYAITYACFMQQLAPHQRSGRTLIDVDVGLSTCDPGPEQRGLAVSVFDVRLV